MKLMYELLVWEQYKDPDQCPEPFGNVFFERIPEPGEIIQLDWEKSHPAYRVKVTSVDLDKLELWTTHDFEEEM